MLKFRISPALGLLFFLIAIGNAEPVYRSIRYGFRDVPVDVLVCSEPGHEMDRRPLVFFVQGSLPIPLRISSPEGEYGVFPFLPDSIIQKYHLVIVGKPGIPVGASADSLQPDFTWREPSTGKVPEVYCRNNRRSWYLSRNAYVLKQLLKQPWADGSRVVVAGHSEGATIAADMAATIPSVTHLVFMSGNPLGRMHTMITQERNRNGNPDGLIMMYKEVVKEPENCDCTYGDPNTTTWEFSIPPIERFYAIKKPALLVWGTSDACVPGMDFLTITAIRLKWDHVYTNPWPGLDHNFMGSDSLGNPDPDQFNWDLIMHRAMNWVEDPGSLR